MGELRKSNGDYTEEGLRYPGMKADIELCYKYLHELCQIVWSYGRSENGYKPKMTMWSIPPRPDNFDMQISAALDELKMYREAEQENRLFVSPVKIGEYMNGKVDVGPFGEHELPFQITGLALKCHGDYGSATSDFHVDVNEIGKTVYAIKEAK